MRVEAEPRQIPQVGPKVHAISWVPGLGLQRGALVLDGLEEPLPRYLWFVIPLDRRDAIDCPTQLARELDGGRVLANEPLPDRQSHLIGHRVILQVPEVAVARGQVALVLDDRGVLSCQPLPDPHCPSI